MNTLEAIAERRSVRNYNGEPLSDEIVEKLEEAIKHAYSPFGGKVTIRMAKFGNGEDFKPSTYGVIKGAKDYFLLGIGEDEASALSAGFRFEQVVLKAWQMGLGTCWIAATFKGSQFDRGQKWPEGESLKIISPVGFAAEKKSFLEKMTRTLLGSHNRKPFGELFFFDDFKTSLPEDNTFAESLRMLRLAPSSTNSQPWRCLVKDDRVLFFYKPKSQVSILDCGIGMCHFNEAEKFNGHKGEFFKESDIPEAPDNWKYLYSYKRNK